MNKKSAIFISILAIMSAITGYMMSSMSWVGRIGMSVFYKEYSFLKVWWKGAILVFAVWLIIFIAHSIVKKRVSKASALAGNLVSLIIAIGGLYFTYSDFRNDFSHGLMGEPFHIGFYLFWLGWISISLFFLAEKSSRDLIVSGKTV